MDPVTDTTAPAGPEAGAAWARSRLRARRAARGRLALIALAAVLTAVAAVQLTVRGLSGTAPAVPAALSVPAPGTAAAAFVQGVPRYYVTLGSDPGAPSGTGLVVGDAVTGKVLAAVPRPAGNTAFTGVTGAGDDRTFVVNAITQQYHPAEFWYLLRILPGNQVQLTRLPVADPYTDALVAGLALSPDGRTLAVMDVPGGRNPDLYPAASAHPSGPVTVGPVTLRTYAVPGGQLLRTWTHPWSGAELPPAEDNWAGLSWRADGRTLGFEYPLGWQTATARSPGSIMTLDTASPGSDLIAAGRLLLPIPAGFACDRGGTALSPDGGTLYCTGGGPPAVCKTTGVTFSAYSTASGQLEHVLYRRVPCFGQNPLIVWAGPGRAVLGVVADLSAKDHGSLSGLMTPGKFTPLKFVRPYGFQPGWIAF